MKPLATTVVSGPPENVSTVAIPPATTTTSPLIETAEEAVAVLSQVSSPEEAAAAIEAIADNIDTLTAEQLDEVARVISAAPVEVKRDFEEQVNIFGGGLDSYVPADSNVTVGQRRALVAVGAVLAAAPVVMSRKR
jgi:hypothetical protein